MAQTTDTLTNRSRQALLSPIVTLALWRLRSTWRLLLVTGLGMLAAVVLVCAVPLYAQVALTAGLRGVLTETPQDSVIALHAAAGTLTAASVERETRTFTSLMRQNLGPYLSDFSTFFIQTPTLPSPALNSSQQVALTGVSLPQAAAHLTLTQGRLPEEGPSSLELALIPETATQLGLRVGGSLPVRIRFEGIGGPLIETLTFQIVGLVRPKVDDLFWQETAFASTSDVSAVPALMSSEAFVAALSRLAVSAQGGAGLIFIDTPDVFWSYQLNVPQIGSADLDDLIARLATAQAQVVLRVQTIEESYVDSLAVIGPAISAPHAPSILERFRDRVAVVSLPVTILAFLLGGLALFFVSLMADLLVDRQEDTIAVLRSRGASRRQIFGSFAVQCLGLGILVLLVGPALAVLLARVVAQGVLPPAEQGALNILTGNAGAAVFSIGWYALAAAGCAVGTVLFAVSGATRRTVLDARREATRSTRQPFWLRWYLDMVVAALAVVGYGVSLYVTHAGVADAQANLLLTTPLTLLAPLFLVIAGTLAFLRFFPVGVRWLARLLNRRPGAAPLLALAQLARTPRQALRLILLLGLTTSFATMSLVFLASQSQQLANMAAHEVGADFGGGVFVESNTFSLAGETAAYRHLPGVRSATLGYADEVDIQDTSVEVRAVDSSTFAQTAIWTSQDASQPLGAVLAQLKDQRALATGAIPVIVDALASERLHLALGSYLLLPVKPVGTLSLLVVAEVQHLPTINDSLNVTGTGDYTPPSGLLLDYQLLAGRAQSIGDTVSVNYVWLRTSDDPAQLRALRSALSSGPLQLENLQDRRLLLADLQTDPLSLTIIGVLIVGACAPLLLALVGSVLASWLSARKRLTSFAVLRALGTEPRHIAGILLWEQGLVYGAAVLLGALFGGLLSLTLAPALVFTGAPAHGPALSSEEFYVWQHVFPTQIVLPPTLFAVFGALVVICVGAIGLMARSIARPSLRQTLRLNED